MFHISISDIENFYLQVTCSFAVGLLLGFVIVVVTRYVIGNCIEYDSQQISHQSTPLIQPSRSYKKRQRLQRTKLARLVARQLAAHRQHPTCTGPLTPHQSLIFHRSTGCSSYVSSHNSTTTTPCSTPATPYEPDYSGNAFSFSRHDSSHTVGSDSGLDLASLMNEDIESEDNDSLATIAEAQSVSTSTDDTDTRGGLMLDFSLVASLANGTSSATTRTVFLDAPNGNQNLRNQDIKIHITTDPNRRGNTVHAPGICTERLGTYEVVNTSNIDSFDLQ